MDNEYVYLLSQHEFEGSIYFDVAEFGGYSSWIGAEFSRWVRLYGRDRVLLLTELEYKIFRETHEIVECEYLP